MNEKVFNCLERFSWFFVIMSRGLCWDFVAYFADFKAAVPFAAFDSIFFTMFSSCAIFLAYYILCFVLVKKHYTGDHKNRFLGECILAMFLIGWDTIKYIKVWLEYM